MNSDLVQKLKAGTSSLNLKKQFFSKGFIHLFERKRVCEGWGEAKGKGETLTQTPH